MAPVLAGRGDGVLPEGVRSHGLPSSSCRCGGRATSCRSGRAGRLPLHFDGARLWEAAPFYGRPYAEIAALADSVYVSFSKGLAPLPNLSMAEVTVGDATDDLADDDVARLLSSLVERAANG